MDKQRQQDTGDDLKQGARMGRKALNALKAAKGASSRAKKATGMRILLGGSGCLITLILAVAFLTVVILLIMLPSILSNSLFNITGDVSEEEYSKDLLTQYEEYVTLIEETISEAYDMTWARIEEIMDDYESRGYDRQTMEDNISGQLVAQADYDVAYILALYSQHTREEPEKWNKEEFKAALEAIQPYMYKLVEPIAEDYYLEPVSYDVYSPVTVNKVTIMAGSSVNGHIEYTFSCSPVSGYYVKSGEAYVETEEGMDIPTYSLSAPIFVPRTDADGNDILPVTSMGGVQQKAYYVPTGATEFVAAIKVNYLKIEIQPFDDDIWENTFSLDFSEIDSQSGLTYGELIDQQAEMLRKLLSIPEESSTDGSETESVSELPTMSHESAAPALFALPVEEKGGEDNG